MLEVTFSPLITQLSKQANLAKMRHIHSSDIITGQRLQPNQNALLRRGEKQVKVTGGNVPLSLLESLWTKDTSVSLCT